MVAFGIFLLALAILVSVLLHEAGHMYVAKAFGMKVTRYFVGFGTTIWSFRRGETEYGLKAIPAGGFVNIVGQVSLDDVDEKDYPRAMVTRPAYQRFLVLVAGSATHFVLALLVFFIAFAAYPQPNGRAVIEQVTGCTSGNCQGAPTSAAAGILQSGDIVTAVDGTSLDGGQSQLPGLIQKTHGGPVHLTVLRDGRTLHETVTPHKVKGRYLIGVEISTDRSRQGIGQAIANSGQTFGTVVKGTFQAFGALPANVAKVFEGNSSNKASANKDRLVSVVGASQLGGEAFNLGGVEPLLLIIASINISFGIFNLLPLLPLDGGHIAVVAVDKLRSMFARVRHRGPPAPTDYEKLVPVTLFFAALIAIVAITALANDIIHPINLSS